MTYGSAPSDLTGLVNVPDEAVAIELGAHPRAARPVSRQVTRNTIDVVMMEDVEETSRCLEAL